MSVHLDIFDTSGEEPKRIAGWTTTNDGEHIPDEQDLTFAELRGANASRVVKWHPADATPEQQWTGADWSNACAGEMGEAANVVKKLRRQEIGFRGVKDPDYDVLRSMLADEIGDTVCYLDLLARHYGIDMGEAVRNKFNRISVREGFEERL